MQRLLLFLLIALLACSGTRQDNIVTEPPVAGDWVDSQLASMSVEEKIGQMMLMVFRPDFYNSESYGFKRLVRLVKDYHVGGVMFYRGMPYEVARAVDRLQSHADLPLLVMADMEWGMPMRVDQTTRFLQNMAIGAIGSEEDAYKMAAITAEEAKSIGIHVGFAPVMDVNNNPDNIIINTRSYGEDPAAVGRLGSAFIRGLQDNGIYATAKHFPGHGDTNVDSHLGLPVITASKERIREVELKPFQAAVDAGVKCMMVAHITYSAFPQMEGRPATLDSYFIQDVLREEMGFEGLVFTDAMDMGGITNNYWAGEAAVMAIQSGIDMVLLPPHIERTHAFVVKAVKEGRIPMSRIDEAVRRLLETKRHFGLHKTPELNLPGLEKTLAAGKHLAAAEGIANKAITLLRDDKNVIPFSAEANDTALVVAITDVAGASHYLHPLASEVGRRVPFVRPFLIDPRTTEAEVQEMLTMVDSVDVVVAGVFVRWGSHKGSMALPDTTVSLLEDFFKVDKPKAVVSFGSPYVIRQLPEVPSYLCAYGTESIAVRAATRAIFGEIPIEAKLPVSIPGYHQVGDGLERQKRSMQLDTQINDDRFHEAYAVLEKAIEEKVFPGAQVAIVEKGKLVAHRAFGHQTYYEGAPAVDENTIYDMASVTKVAATTLVAMRLAEQKRLMLDIPVKSYLPDFSGGEKDSVTVRHLFTHSGGVHWWADLWNKAENKQGALEYIYDLPLDYTPGDSMIYSDLGLIMIGEIIEVITGKRIDQLAKEMYYKPLGMKDTGYQPDKSLLPRIAPTEIGGSMNRELIHGDVHDENTFFFDNVSSHAGLFSTAKDMAVLAQMILNGGIYNHRRYFKPETLQEWTSRQNMPEGSIRALGWTTPYKRSLAGSFFSPGSFGHTGYTGTSLWIDPNRDIAIVLLTNRVHPTRERGGMSPVRRAFHDAAMKAMTE